MYKNNRDSSVDIGTRLRTGRQRNLVSRIIAEGREFSVLHIVQTASGAHPASYTVGTGGCFSGREADYSLPSSTEIKNGGAILHSPKRIHGIGLN
jgi:hypothetical protein